MTSKSNMLLTVSMLIIEYLLTHAHTYTYDVGIAV